jgi:methylisocitrate lyase
MNMMGKKLRDLMESKDIVYTIGVGDAFGAKLANEYDGFDAVLSSGFQVSAMQMGLPDAELYTKSDNVYAVSNMAYVLKKPLIADIDTAYGNAISAIKSVRDFEQAGAAAVIIEDQKSPKRCPICVDALNTLISAEEGAKKIQAVVENKKYKETIIIARTDATDYEELLKRSKIYIQAGADVIQPTSKALPNKEIYKQYVKDVNFPVSMIVVGWMDGLSKEDIIEIGPKICQFALTPVETVYTLWRDVFDYVSTKLTNKDLPYTTSHKELVNFLGMNEITKLEQKYLIDESQL